MNDDHKLKVHLPNIRTRSSPTKHIPLSLDFAALGSGNTSGNTSSTSLGTPSVTHIQTSLPPPPLSAGAESSTSAGSDVPTPTTAGPEPSTPVTGNGVNSASKEKRKRSRVTPEQLTQLERIFVLDKSPTAQRRKEISDMLGMQERQTQIWFQNRRAKAKLQEVKRSSLSQLSDSNSPPHTPLDMSGTYDVELQQLLHEEDPVTVIPCTELSVGTWRRIATTPIVTYPSSQSKPGHDLVAYMSPAKRCLSWFIQSEGYGFKMEIPFDTIATTELSDASSSGAGQALASFTLTRPPNFYLETAATSPVSAPRGRISIGGHGSSNSNGKAWKRCADWTEGMQATSVFRHELIGNAPQVMHVLRILRGDPEPRSASLQLLNPPYGASTASGELSPDGIVRITPALPQTPLANLGAHSPTSPLSAGGYYSDSIDYQHRQRSYTSGPPSFNDPFHGQHVQDHAYSPAATSFQSSQLPPPSHRSSYPSDDYGYHPSSHPHSTSYPSPIHQQHSPISDYPNIPISQAPRSVSLPHIHLQPNPSPSHDDRYSSTAGSYGTSVTPPLLTTPFSPSDSLIRGNEESLSSNHEASDVYSRRSGSNQDGLNLGYPLNHQ